MTDQLSNDLASLRIEPSQSSREPIVWRRWGWMVAFLLLALAAVTSLAPYISAYIYRTEVGVTEVAMISPASATAKLVASGYVVAEKRSEVGAEVEGRIDKVLVVQGDRVEAGAPLIRLRDADQRSRIAARQAHAAAAQARTASLEVQASELDRKIVRDQRLMEQGIIGKAEVDALTAELRALRKTIVAAQADTAAARADTETLKLELERLILRAPTSGTVVTPVPVLGQVVSSLSGPLLEVVDFSTLIAEVDVPEARLSRIKVGDACEISLDAFVSHRFRGRLREIGPIVNRSKATVMVKVGFEDDVSGVLPNMAARVSFLGRDLSEEEVGKPAKLVVPASALTNRDGVQVVFTIDRERVRMEPVEVGEAIGSSFELLKGPRVGTKLVKNPPATLLSGNRIKENHRQ